MRKSIFCSMLVVFMAYFSVMGSEKSGSPSVEYIITPVFKNETLERLHVEAKIDTKQSGEIFNLFPQAELKCSENATITENPTYIYLSHKKWDDKEPITVSYDLTPDILQEKMYRGRPFFMKNDFLQLTGSVLLLIPQRYQKDDLSFAFQWNTKECPWLNIGSSLDGVVQNDKSSPIIQLFSGKADELYKALFIGGNFKSIETKIQNPVTKQEEDVVFAFQGKLFEELTQGQIIKDTETILKTEFQLMEQEEKHFPRIISLSEIGEEASSLRYGGEFLDKGIIIQVSKNHLESKKSFLHLLAHEIFHTFNNGTTFPNSWLFREGFTDFMANYSLLKAGLISLDDYVASINKSALLPYYTSPIRFVNSRRLNDPSSEDPLLIELAYTKGYMMGVLLDHRLNELSGGTLSLSNLLQGYYKFLNEQQEPLYASWPYVILPLLSSTQKTLKDRFDFGKSSLVLRKDVFVTRDDDLGEDEGDVSFAWKKKKEVKAPKRVVVGDGQSVWSQLSKSEQKFIKKDSMAKIIPLTSQDHKRKEHMDETFTITSLNMYFSQMIAEDLLESPEYKTGPLILKLLGKIEGKDYEISDVQEIISKMMQSARLSPSSLVEKYPILSKFTIADIYQAVDFAEMVRHDYSADELSFMASVHQKLHTLPLSVVVEKGFKKATDDFVFGDLVGARHCFELLKRGFSLEEVNKYFGEKALKTLSILMQQKDLKTINFKDAIVRYLRRDLTDIFHTHDRLDMFKSDIYPGFELAVAQMPSFNAFINLIETVNTKKITGVKKGSPAEKAGLKDGQDFVSYRESTEGEIPFFIITTKQGEFKYIPFETDAIFEVPVFKKTNSSLKIPDFKTTTSDKKPVGVTEKKVVSKSVFDDVVPKVVSKRVETKPKDDSVSKEKKKVVLEDAKVVSNKDPWVGPMSQVKTGKVTPKKTSVGIEVKKPVEKDLRRSSSFVSKTPTVVEKKPVVSSKASETKDESKTSKTDGKKKSVEELRKRFEQKVQ